MANEWTADGSAKLEVWPKTRFKNRDCFSVGESTFKVDV